MRVYFSLKISENQNSTQYDINFSEEDFIFNFQDQQINAYEKFKESYSSLFDDFSLNMNLQKQTMDYLFTILNLNNFSFNIELLASEDFDTKGFSKSIYVKFKLTCLVRQIKLFICLLDFSRKYSLVKSADDVVLSLKKKNILNELKNLKIIITDEIKKNNCSIQCTDNLHDLFKIAIKYDADMIKLRKGEVDIEFDYLFLGPEFLVSSSQPALGMVYKIMQMNNLPCIKFSEDKDKQTIPDSKSIYRLFDSENNLIGDYLCLVNEKDDFVNEKSIKAL